MAFPKLKEGRNRKTLEDRQKKKLFFLKKKKEERKFMETMYGEYKEVIK